MVTDHRFLRALGAMSLLVLCGHAAELPAYRLDDVADGDVVTPMTISVTDPEATRQRQQKEARKIPVYARYSTQVVHQVEASIRAEASAIREQFLDLLEAEYGMRRLQFRHTETGRFKNLWQQFSKEHSPFPRPRELYIAWATDTADEPHLAEWFDYLHEAMAGPVRTKYLEGLRVGSNAPVRLVPVEDLESPVEEEWALANFSPTRASTIVTLWSVRQELRVTLAESPGNLRGYLAGKVELNCVMDPELTERVRQRVVGGLLVTHTYQAGEPILKDGQKVDGRALAALTALREKLQVQTLEMAVATGKAQTRRIEDRALWLGGLLVAVTAVLVFLGIRLRMKKQRSLVPVLGASMIHGASDAEVAAGPTIVDAGPPGREAWQQRALLAEEQVEQARDLAKARLMPHLAKQLKDNVVQELATQRHELMSAQEAVAEQMVELEERLKKIHGPLSERLNVYKQRIGELETELAQRGAENRTLIRARIEALQKEMENEQLRGGAKVS